jgi:putative transposase
MSKISKAKCKQKRNMKRAARRLRWKIKDLISDLHHKAARFFVNTFDTIYLPSFETSQMVTKLMSKTARMMQTFSHYSFQQFLIAKAEEYSAKVVICSEAYTSKTCSYCGKIHKIGSKKVMKCECGIEVSRDYNGARGILLRALAVTPPLETVGNC